MMAYLFKVEEADVIQDTTLYFSSNLAGNGDYTVAL
jgi:hypothetical protein